MPKKLTKKLIWKRQRMCAYMLKAFYPNEHFAMRLISAFMRQSEHEQATRLLQMKHPMNDDGRGMKDLMKGKIKKYVIKKSCRKDN